MSPARAVARKKIVLGVGASIAAYKSAELAREFMRAGAEVRCVLTPHAARFITPLTLSALTGHPAMTSLWEPSLWQMSHLALASWADQIVIAPATADILSSLAAGRAQSLLDSLVLAARVPVTVCPAMDAEMWEHPATKANVRRLADYGYRILGPVKGELASGKVGMGRLMEPREIVLRCLGRRQRVLGARG